MSSWLGPFAAASLVVAAGVLALRSWAPYGIETALSIALGSASIAAMSVTLVLSARPPLIEYLFGGLDRVYVVHKWLGICALVLMLGHFVWDPELGRSVRRTGVGESAADVGEIALYGFIALVLISWIKRIPFTRLELPWPLWRLTHRFTGALFAVVAFHQLAVDKPSGINPVSGDYLNALSVVGIAAWLFTQLVAPLLRPRTFVVESVERHGSVAEISLRAQGRALRWRPGQFAFLSAPDAGMREAHPFTIASAPNTDGTLRFAIKALGRWSRRLPDRVASGQRMRLDGPYGRFVFRRRALLQVWLAGGIGITPFLAWAEGLTDQDHQQIVLIWAVTARDEAYATHRLTTIAARHPNLTVHIIVSNEVGRLTAKRLTQLVPFSMTHAELFYCGPQGLRTTIVGDLRRLGQVPRRVHSEAFEFR